MRFHGPSAVEHPYQGRYREDGLFWMAHRLSSWIDEGRDVYVYFNNDGSGFAVDDARWFSDRLRNH